MLNLLLEHFALEQTWGIYVKKKIFIFIFFYSFVWVKEKDTMSNMEAKVEKKTQKNPKAVIMFERI